MHPASGRLVTLVLGKDLIAKSPVTTGPAPRV